MIRYGQTTRTFKTLPVGNKNVELVVHIPRLFCYNCGSIRQVALKFADPKKHYTHSLERFVIDLCRVMTIADVADLTGLSWDTVKEIDKSYLKEKYHSVSLKDVRYIAIDEVYLGRKRKFITIVMDLESGRVIHIGKGKGKDALNGLWKRLKRSAANILSNPVSPIVVSYGRAVRPPKLAENSFVPLSAKNFFSRHVLSFNP